MFGGLGISKQLEQFIQKCPACCKNFQIVTEPVITTELPSKAVGESSI